MSSIGEKIFGYAHLFHLFFEFLESEVQQLTVLGQRPRDLFLVQRTDFILSIFFANLKSYSYSWTFCCLKTQTEAKKIFLTPDL